MNAHDAHSTCTHTVTCTHSMHMHAYTILSVSSLFWFSNPSWAFRSLEFLIFYYRLVVWLYLLLNSTSTVYANYFSGINVGRSIWVGNKSQFFDSPVQLCVIQHNMMLTDEYTSLLHYIIPSWQFAFCVDMSVKKISFNRNQMSFMYVCIWSFCHWANFSS